MKSRRKKKATKWIGLPTIINGVRKALAQHVQKHVASYAPALSPVLFFILAHVLTLLTLVFMKAGVLQSDQGVCKTVVTWAVYGFIPFLLSSYGSFFLAARPAAVALERKYPDWSVTLLNLATGAVYGAVLVVALVLLLRPDTWMGRFLLVCIGGAAGQGNWYFYRRLAGGDA